MQQGKKDEKIEANLILRILKNHIITNEKIHDLRNIQYIGMMIY